MEEHVVICVAFGFFFSKIHRNWGIQSSLSQSCFAPEDGPELSTKTGLHQHVEELPVLERLEKLHNELAVRLLHDLLL